ncbi:FAD-dependent monooxygenase [Actinoplanes sp. NPDC049596]|uniref:FAD-dependent monooxygenase n=1 Tax=unclassified Actinoplanes TaxID=2626549 RepID=UPI00342C388D
MTDNTSVLIAGGGVAGLALRRALLGRGLPAEVAERDPQRSSGGLAIHLTGNAVAALGVLGLEDHIERMGRPVRRREYRDRTGRLLCELDEQEFWPVGSRPRLVRRADLVAALASEPVGPSSRTPDEVRLVQLVPNGVEVSFADGRVEEHGFLVGADGVHSTVRSQVLGDAAPRAALLSAAGWRTMTVNPGLDCFTAWNGPEGVVLLIPLSDTEAYFYASAVDGGPVGTDPGWLQRAFRGFPDPVREALDHIAADPAQLYHSPIEEIRIPVWSRGRAALIGDAAHAMAPVWAAGVGLALEDAIVLADVLADGDWDTAGARLEQRRRPRVDHVAKMTDRTSRGANTPAWLRRLIIPRAYRSTYTALRKPIEVTRGLEMSR